MAALHGGDIYRSSLINRDILDFSININPLGLPESVKKAAAAGIAESCRYPDVECRALRSALSHYEKVPEHSILFGNGAAELIYAFSLALRPRSVLLPAPTFSEYEESLSTIDCSIRYLMLDKNDGFTIHSGDLTAALTDSTDLLFLCNPNNPTGTLMSRDEIERVLTVCRDRHIRVLLDECFLDFTANEILFRYKPNKGVPESFSPEGFYKEIRHGRLPARVRTYFRPESAAGDAPVYPALEHFRYRPEGRPRGAFRGNIRIARPRHYPYRTSPHDGGAERAGIHSIRITCQLYSLRRAAGAWGKSSGAWNDAA